jgi:hypothetical protein
VLDAYGWEHARMRLVIIHGGGVGGLHGITRVSARGTIYGCRLRADGTVSREKQLTSPVRYADGTVMP